MVLKQITLTDYFYDKTTSDERYVQKVSGKDLSANDYTTAEKIKLAGIDVGATKTIIDSTLSTNSTNPVENKVVTSTLNSLSVDKANRVDLAPIALSGSYEDLENVPDIPSKVSELTNDTGFITNAAIENLGGVVTVEQQASAESGYTATYVVKQGGQQVGTKINIPKDFLVKSASVKTASANNTPQSGFSAGDKYLDFIINTKDNSATDEHLYVNVKDLISEYSADETTLTLNNGVFSIKSGVIPQANATATNIKMNGTQSAGSATTYAKADHVHPVDTSRAAASHSHGSITNDGKIGTTSGKPIITGTGGALQAGNFGTTAGTFAEGNHTHDYLSLEDLEDIIGLSYNPSTGVLSIDINNQ